MTVYENIASPLRVAGLPRAEIDRRVGEAAELLHLTPLLARRPQQLSGGQQQRTALARAIVKDSELVLLDEPLANLDYKLREELRDQLPRLFSGRGAIVVYATSEPSEALLLGGHTATVSEGRVTQFGPTAVCYRIRWILDTARVFSDPPINAAPVEKQGGEIVLLDQVRWPAAGPAAALPDGRYTLGLRPHFVAPARSDAGKFRSWARFGSPSCRARRASRTSPPAPRPGWRSPTACTGTGSARPTRFYLDVAHGLYFRADGRRVA